MRINTVEAFDCFRGPAGKDGKDGETPRIDPGSGHWFVGGEDTGVTAQGPAGKDGTNGKDGEKGEAGRDAKWLSFFATLPAASWQASGALFSQTVACAGVLETDTPLADIVQTGNEENDAAMRAAWACVTRITTSENSITAYATQKPDADIPIQMKGVR